MVTQNRFRGRVPAFPFDETQHAIRNAESELRHAFGHNSTVRLAEDDLRVIIQYIKHLENELESSIEKGLVLPEPLPRQQAIPMFRGKSWV